MSYIETFRQASRLRQIIVAGSVFAVFVVVGVAIYILFVRTPYSPLFTDVRPAEAASIVAELDKTKTPYRLANGGATILVPSKLADATRLSVMSDDLPLKGMVGFELFNKSDMGLTEFAQKIDYQRALQGELARTIMTLDGVDSARVHLSLPDPSVFRDDKRDPKASATIITRPGVVLPAATVAGIRRLIAAAVPDLQIADVVILDQRGNLLVGDAPSDSATDWSPDLQQARAVEQFYTAKVRQVLLKAYPRASVAATIPAQVMVPGVADDLRARLDQWTPASRRFGLAITISTGAPLGPTQAEAIRASAQSAVGKDLDGQADDVMVSPDGAPVTPLNPTGGPEIARLAAAPPLADPSPALAGPRQPTPAVIAWAAALVLLPLVFVAGFLARRSTPAPRELTERDRQAFVERLRERIGKEVASANP